MPERIQRKRSKGWTSPKGAAYVGRPTRWGNPWLPIGGDYRSAVQRYEDNLYHTLIGVRRGGEENRLWDRFNGPNDCRRLLADLRGKDLMCWCPPGRPCHVDVLLIYANREDL